MSEQLQLRRNTAPNLASFTGQIGECVVDTTNNRIVVNDFATAGGWPAAKLSEAITRNRVAVSDANYTFTAPAYGTTWVNIVAYTALAAPRTVTLPAAANYPAGARLVVLDEVGLCSPALTISVMPAGTDTINGNSSATPVVLNQKCAYVGVESNGSNAWTVTDSYYGQAGYRMALSPNGASAIIQISEIVASGLSGTTVTLSGAIPANVLVLACSMRVITAITGATAYEVGSNIANVTSPLQQFGSGLNPALGSTNLGTVGPTPNYVAANLIITATTGSFTGGAIRLALMYLQFGAPTQ